MAIRREAFIGQYLDELDDNIRGLESALIAVKRDPESEEDLNRATRVLHTIKGSSRMLKFKNMERLAHGLENVFKGIKEKRYRINESIAQLVLAAARLFRKGARMIKDDGDDAVDIDRMLKACDLAHGGEPFNPGDLDDTEEPAAAARYAEPADDTIPVQGISLENTSIRVKTDRIDEIVRMLNNLIINQFQFKKYYDEILSVEDRLKSQSTGVAGVGRGSDGGILKKFEKMRKEFKEQIGIIERDTFALQESVIGLRMFPLEMILGNIPGMVEELSLTLGKKVDLSIKGGDVAIDKMILETIHDPLIHLVRNSIDHGIETPEERSAAGKNPEGRLKISCRSEGGGITITITDDGRGIDYDRIKSRAAMLFPDRKDELEFMSEEELASMLFLPGFSTASSVTELSGRGVGLDIVRHNVEKVKGRISIESRTGSGTLFTLALPLTLATIDGYFVSSGGGKFFVPAGYIKEVLLINPEDKIKILNRDAVKVRDRLIPLYSLSLLLNLDTAANVESGFALIVESPGSYIGVIIDTVLEYVTLIYKPLPKNIRGMGYIQGIVFDESYDIVNILHIPALIERSKRLTDIDLKYRFSGSGNSGICVLVVDDSANSRDIQKSILESAGFDVLTARDGIEALEMLRTRDVMALITDINMPRMDGYTLIENIKRDAALKNIPVIVVSNYDDAESSRRALTGGADSYIIKSDFDRNNLVETVQELISRTRSAR